MVADFIGEGSTVPAKATGKEADGRCPVSLCGVETTLRCGSGEAPREAYVCLRPENLAIAVPGTGNTISCRVVRAIYRGGVTAVEVVLVNAPVEHPPGEGGLLFLLVQGPAPKTGDDIGVTVTDGWVIPIEG